jgi:alkanesulfonate monooxygenase SsuD/methylene tetrahydromethanopterin reductase-like flavin-dependent oxidoreductase (luciferase family)
VPPRLGFVAPTDPTTVRRLEDQGVSSFWVGGHIASVNPSPEPVVWLSRLVEQTRSATVGTATLVLPLYPPALLAKQIADLDNASDGRVVLGIGVGGEYESDFAAVGVARSQRGSRANESIGLLRRLWTGEPVVHHGRHFSFDDLRIHPAPARPGGPPIVVSGRSEAAMRRAALLGDGWMPYLYSPSRYASSVQRVTDIAGQNERSVDGFGWYAYLMVAVDPDPAMAKRGAVDFLGSTYRQDVSAMVDRITVSGSIDDVGERMAEFVEAGARHLIVCPMHGDVPTLAGSLLEDVVPRLST